jgi:archaeosortase A (PGF-CTERM-specific)
MTPVGATTGRAVLSGQPATTGGLAVTPFDVAMLVSLFFLCAGLLGTARGDADLERTGGALAFALLAALGAAVAVGKLADGTTAVFLGLVTLGGVGYAVVAGRLLLRGWKRSGQLLAVTATAITVLLIYEVQPALQTRLLEGLTAVIATAVRLVGYEAVVTAGANGDATRLVFGNGTFLQMAPACSGIGALALFAALVAGARTSYRKRLLGLLVVVVAVYGLNLLRLSFTGLALAGNWFGALGGGGPTSVQTSYLVAEIVVGQTFVVAASVVSFFILSRWIPDMREFVRDLFDTLPSPGR